MGAAGGRGLGAVVGSSCRACEDPSGSKAASAVAAAAGLRMAPKPNGTMALSCCPEEDQLRGDDQTMLDYQLLSAAADGNMTGIVDALESGANIEARRPLVFRATKPSEPADDEEDFQEVLVLEGQGVFQSRGFGYADKPAAGDKSQGGSKQDDLQSSGLTPLMRAAKEGRVQAIALLLDKKAYPNSRDEDGQTPLFFAAAAGCRASCATLLRAGADRSAVDNAQKDAFAHVPREFLRSTKERGEWISLLRHEETASNV